MREIVLDTETTGLDPFDPEGRHRIVEIGGVELSNHLPTGRAYHQYINPERDMPAEAFAVHGLGDEFLAKQPVFADIARAFTEFVGDAKLVIHNASFDMKFLNAELGWLRLAPLPADQAIDTLAIARERFPGAQVSLDALCKRFGIDNSAREKHGALLDSELLAEVYLELLGGRQHGMELVSQKSRGPVPQTGDGDWRAPARPHTLACRLTEAERAAHDRFIAELGDDSIWMRGG